MRSSCNKTTNGRSFMSLAPLLRIKGPFPHSLSIAALAIVEVIRISIVSSSLRQTKSEEFVAQYASQTDSDIIRLLSENPFKPSLVVLLHQNQHTKAREVLILCFP